MKCGYLLILPPEDKVCMLCFDFLCNPQTLCSDMNFKRQLGTDFSNENLGCYLVIL